MDADQGEPTPAVRVSEPDRNRVVDILKDRTADGTLTLDEFAQRVDRALSARDAKELGSVTADLPVAPPEQTRRRQQRQHLLAVMGGAHTRGRWRCGDSITAIAVMGGCHLDFRGAEIDTDEVRVTAIAVMGGIEIVVPEGVEVSMTGLPVMGGRAVRIKDVAPLPGAPRIVVQAFPIMGGVNVRSLPRRARDDVEPAPAQHDTAAAPLDGIVTIMFSDLCGYSELTDRLGDGAALDLLREHNRIVRDQIVAHGGQEVKASGDGFMVAFSSVARSLRCAADLQRALAERNRASGSESIRVHIGIHAGEALRDGNDFLGGTVIVASRLADAAAPEEILVSSVARELADSSREFAFGLPRSVALKGFLDARQAYPLRWQPLDDVTRADRVG